VIGGIRREEIDEERMIKKCQRIIGIYNASNELQLAMDYKIHNDEYAINNTRRGIADDVLLLHIAKKYKKIFW